MAGELHTFLLECGIKPSVQRMAVMHYLRTHFTHPTADEIHSALSPLIPTLSKTTVYNTLKLLAARGAILSLDIDEKNTHFDGDVSPHAHFRCRGCGRIFDLPLGIPSVRLAETDSSFLVDEIQLYYKGYCATCKNQ